MQLNPVAEKPVDKHHSSGYEALAPSIWQLFHLQELHEIVRQKSDPKFAELLSRVRVGEQTDEDMEALKGLEKNEEIPRGSLSIFLTNELKDNYNKKQLSLLTSGHY